jgi:hypothetical protein
MGIRAVIGAPGPCTHAIARSVTVIAEYPAIGDHVLDAPITCEPQIFRKLVSVHAMRRIMGDVERAHHALGIRIVIRSSGLVRLIADRAVIRAVAIRIFRIDLIDQRDEAFGEPPCTVACPNHRRSSAVLLAVPHIDDGVSDLLR